MASESVVCSTGRPCAVCPWRLANQGTPHPHGFYTKTNLRRLWTGLKAGERMTCHPRDPRMAEFEGYEKTAASQSTPECAGALVLIQRELAKFSHLAKTVDAEDDDARPGEALRRYRRTSPAAMTREGLGEHLFALAMPTNPLTGLHAPAVHLADPEVGYAPLGDFEPEAWTLGLNEKAGRV
jgi:hypothetical protein